MRKLALTVMATTTLLTVPVVAHADTVDPGPAFVLQDDRIAESSGIVRSTRDSSTYFTHNDAGDVPRDPGARIAVGPVLLEVVRVAAPCKLLDDTIGVGAQEALRRRAGSVCRVLESGTIRVGDPVDLDAR